MNKTTKALKLAEEAFEALVHTPIAGYIWTGKCNPALFAIREALAEQAEQRPQNCGTGYCSCIECPYEAEQVEQEPLMDYERINALREGEQNGAEDAYFFVRPENDTPTLRKMFCQGFERGFHKGLKYAAPVQQVDLTDDEIAQAVGSLLDEVYLADFRAVIAADREKNK